AGRDRIEIRQSLLRLHIGTTQDFNDDEDRTGQHRRSRAGGGNRVVDYTVTVPAAMSISVSGPYTDVDISGTRGEVNVETVQGEVKVHGGSGNISLESVNGGVT